MRRVLKNNIQYKIKLRFKSFKYRSKYMYASRKTGPYNKLQAPKVYVLDQLK